MTDNNTVDERPVVLKVDHVAKSFRLPTEQATGLKMAFLNWTKGIKGYTCLLYTSPSPRDTR